MKINLTNTRKTVKNKNMKIKIFQMSIIITNTKKTHPTNKITNETVQMKKAMIKTDLLKAIINNMIKICLQKETFQI